MKRLPERCAVDAFFAHLGADCSASSSPLDAGSDTGSVSIGAVEVLTRSLVADELEVVIEPIPIDFGLQPHTSFCFGTKADDEAAVALVLIGIGGTIEGVGTIAFLAVACLQVDAEVGCVVVALKVCVALLEV